jgi:DNA-binding GntR family transcriptional regulator
LTPSMLNRRIYEHLREAILAGTLPGELAAKQA